MCSKRKIALVAVPLVATSALILNLVEKDYLTFFNPLELIPKDSQVAKVIDGDTTDCISKPNQTKPVDVNQIKNLKTIKTTRDAITVLGNSFCETSVGTLRYITTTGKNLDLSLDKVLDYDFSKTTTTAKTRELQSRVSVRDSRKTQDSK